MSCKIEKFDFWDSEFPLTLNTTTREPPGGSPWENLLNVESTVYCSHFCDIAVQR